jgi:hypothetical protein
VLRTHVEGHLLGREPGVANDIDVEAAERH